MTIDLKQLATTLDELRDKNDVYDFYDSHWPPVLAEIERLRAQLENAEVAHSTVVVAYEAKQRELEAELQRFRDDTRYQLTDARALDWKAVDEAAAMISKQCESIAFCPPEALDIHRMRAVYVCQALDKICAALKLSSAVKEDLGKVIAARKKVLETEKVVTEWMDAEARELRLVRADQAPGWAAYEAATVEWGKMITKIDEAARHG